MHYFPPTPRPFKLDVTEVTEAMVPPATDSVRPGCPYETPLATPRKIIWILQNTLTMSFQYHVPKNLHHPTSPCYSVAPFCLVVINTILPQSTHTLMPPPLYLD